MPSDEQRIDLLLVYTDSLADDCKALRKDRDLIGVPILCIGREGCGQGQNQAMRAGATDYIDLANLTIPVFESKIQRHYDLKYRGDLLAEIAKIDPLTGVPNRAYFDETIDIEWRRCCREFAALSLLIIDIDTFGAFNEHYGAGVGDNCLKRVATSVNGHCLRATDRMGRYDDDAFAVILPGTEFEGAIRFAENVCKEVASIDLSQEVSDGESQVTVSVGVATIDPKQNQDLSMLMSEVEEMLNNAQHQGGNCVQSVEL